MSVTHLELVEEMNEQPMPFSRFNFGDDYDDDDDDEDGVPKIRIGICAMSKKVSTNYRETSIVKSDFVYSTQVNSAFHTF